VNETWNTNEGLENEKNFSRNWIRPGRAAFD
jgi:hypothetical protein